MLGHAQDYVETYDYQHLSVSAVPLNSTSVPLVAAASACAYGPERTLLSTAAAPNFTPWKKLTLTPAGPADCGLVGACGDNIHTCATEVFSPAKLGNPRDARDSCGSTQ
jgi:hypothetical protein